MTNYNGSDLAAYANREKADPRAQKPEESDVAYARRVNFWYAASDAVTEQDEWRAHRARVDNVPSGTGLYGHANPQQRAQALGSPGAAFGGDQRVERNGHLVRENNHNQPGLQRVYLGELRDPGRVSPLMRWFTSPEHEGWQ